MNLARYLVQSAAVWSPFPSPQREASRRRTPLLALPQLAADLWEELCGERSGAERRNPGPLSTDRAIPQVVVE